MISARGKYSDSGDGLWRGGFTLIELLAVIAVIMILTGMLLAGATAAKKRATYSRAEAEARELAKAWKSYWMIFGEWPAGYFSAGVVDMDGSAMTKLQGGNPQKIIFMDLEANVKTDGFRDPWGSWYRVDFDKMQSPSAEYYEATVFLPQKNRFAH